MDVYSLYAATMISLLVAGAAMIVVAFAYRQTPGFLSCGIGCLLAGVGAGLILLRTIVPGRTVILLSNLVLIAGAKYLLDGVRVFRNKKPVPFAGFSVFSAIFISCILYWLYVDENLAVRTGIASLMFGSATVYGGVTVLSGVVGKDRNVYWLTGGTIVLAGTFLIARGVAAFIAPPSGRLMGEGIVEAGTLIAINFGSIVCGFGLLTASHLRFIREAEDLAMHDPLTGLANRRNFEERFLQAGRRASRSGRRLALIYIDVDGFKQINDSLGHEAGDIVLRTVALRILNAVRETDCLARLGGDEFVLLLEEAGGHPELAAIVNRLKRCVGRELSIAGQELRPSISCGLAVYPDDVQVLDRLIAHADVAMYDAKRQVLANPSPASDPKV